MFIQLLQIKIFEMSETTRVILTITGSVIAFLVAVLLAMLLIRFLLRRFRRILTVDKWIRLENRGNTRSVFRLSAVCPKDPLVFEFEHEGIKLPYIHLPIEADKDEEVQPLLQTPKMASSSNGKKSPAKSNGSAVGAVKKRSKAGIGLGRQFGAILSALGSLIPGSVGSSLKEKATAIQNTTQKASDTIEAPEQKKREAEHIRSQVQHTFGSSKKTEDKTNSGNVPKIANMSETVTSEAVVPQQAVKAKKQKLTRTSMVQTPLLSPGETLKIKLGIHPVSIYRSGSFSYRIDSSQLFQTPDTELAAVNLTQLDDRIQIKGISSISGVVYFLLLFLVVILNGLWLILFVNWLIQTLL